MKNLILTLALVFVAHTAFALTIKGHTSKPVHTETDSIYAALAWGTEDSPSVVAGASKVIHGTFVMDVAVPPASGIYSEEGFEFSVAYIILFKDMDGNGTYERKTDMVAGISETHCVTYVQGDFNAFIDRAEVKKEEKITNLRSIKEGIYLAKVVPAKGDEVFDDLQYTDAVETEIKVGNLKELNVPNWT